MPLQPNISIVDRYIRLTTGILAVFESSKRRRSSLNQGVILTIGAMKIAEGMTGWCPLTYAKDLLMNKNNSTSEKTGHAENHPPSLSMVHSITKHDSSSAQLTKEQPTKQKNKETNEETDEQNTPSYPSHSQF